MSGAGTLTLNGETETTADKRYITNTYTGTDDHYVISVDENILKNGTECVVWNDTNLQIQSDSAGDNFKYIVQGYSQGDSTTAANYVKPKENYLLMINDSIAYMEPQSSGGSNP